MALSKIKRGSLNTGIDDNSDATAITIDSSENVGIGTTSPSVALHVQSGGGQIRLHEGAAADNKYGEIEVSNGKLILHSDKGNVENSSDMQFKVDNILAAKINDARTLTLEKPGNQNPTLVINGSDTNGYYNVQFEGASTNGYKALFRHGTAVVGTIITTSSSTAYNTSSDARLKENIADMTGAIARVKQLSPKRFSWIVDDLDAPNVDGFLAHEAQAVVPEAVHGTHNQVDDEGEPVYQGIDQSKLVPLLTAALKESIAKIETLETEMTALKARVTALEDA